MTQTLQQNFGAGTYELLLVEDNPGDVRLLQEAMGKVEIDAALHVMSDGTEVLDFLNQRNEYSDVPSPDVILLDLNLPQMNGIDVLCELDETETLARVPVIILTNSTAEDDIRQAYECGANAYLTKPLNQTDFVELMQVFKKFWLTSAQLPPTQ